MSSSSISSPYASHTAASSPGLIGSRLLAAARQSLQADAATRRLIVLRHCLISDLLRAAVLLRRLQRLHSAHYLVSLYLLM